jgi:hypothetical protein
VSSSHAGDDTMTGARAAAIFLSVVAIGFTVAASFYPWAKPSVEMDLFRFFWAIDNVFGLLLCGIALTAFVAAVRFWLQVFAEE